MALKKIWQALFGKDEVKFTEAHGSTIEDDEAGWRKLTGDSRRDLNPITQERMQELAVYQWRTDPLANRLVELPVAYLLAEGVRLKVDDDEAQGWLNDFWDDPINCMDIKLAKKVREMSLYGEQCWPVFVNEMNGHCRLGYLDPGDIETVVTDPDNVEQPIGIVTKRNSKGIKRRFQIIVNGPESVFSQRTQEIRATFDDGPCFFFTINDLSNASRGTSDLLSELDWIDGYAKALFGELERWDHLRAFIWDVKMTGATPEEIDERASKITAPKAGSVRLHNDAEEWTAVTPDLKSEDSGKLARVFRNHIMGGGTIPEHWFGGGGDVNRATAGEMGEPTFKIFTMRQTTWKYILCELGKYQLRRRMMVVLGEGADELIKNDEYTVFAEFPELTARDTSKYAQALQQVVVACGLAIERGVMTEETAAHMIANMASQLGVEIDPDVEMENVRAFRAKMAELDNMPDFPDDEDDAEAA